MISDEMSDDFFTAMCKNNGWVAIGQELIDLDCAYICGGYL